MVSLSKRLTVLVLALLCLCWALAGFVIYGSVRRTLESELNRRLEVRLAWLGAAMSVELLEGGGQIKLHRRRDPADAAGSWRVATRDGLTLWASGKPEPAAPTIERTRVLVFGDPTLPLASRSHFVSREELVWGQIPPTVRDALERAVPGFIADRVERMGKSEPAVLRIEGRGRRRAYAVMVDETGRLLGTEPGDEVDLDSSAMLPRYRVIGKPGRLELLLTARTSTAAMDRELARTAWGLETVGPLSLLITGACWRP